MDYGKRFIVVEYRPAWNVDDCGEPAHYEPVSPDFTTREEAAAYRSYYWQKGKIMTIDEFNELCHEF